MFANESIKWIIVYVLLAVVTIGGAMVTGMVVVADDETEEVKFDVIEETVSTVSPDPNAFTSDLDHLRQMGQVEAGRASAEIRRAEIYKYASVYDHSSDLEVLRENAATIDLTANDREKAVVREANDFTTQLDHLRQTGQQATISSHLSGEVFDHTTDLDTLRANAAVASLSAGHHTDVVINDANEYISYLDNLRDLKGAASIRDANDFTSYLDRLRQQGQTGSR